ncbi:MAG: HAD-IIB family hydrolase [Desulfococcaceae bacterium]
MKTERRILLCSDLDRTLLPNGPQPESPDARPLLRHLADRPELELVYVTGRDRDLIWEGIRNYDLPLPRRVIGDVGTTLYTVSADREGVHFSASEDWKAAIGDDWQGMDRQALSELFSDLDGIRPQEPEKQNEFKLSYYADPELDADGLMDRMDERMRERDVRSNLIWSIDEEKNLGLLDVLPESANKLHAIRFLMKKLGFGEDSVIFSGDSGNDLNVLTSGLRSILVANAAEAVRRKALDALALENQTDRLYIARGDFLGMNGNYSAGVLEGLVHFEPEARSWIASALSQFNRNGR